MFANLKRVTAFCNFAQVTQNVKNTRLLSSFTRSDDRKRFQPNYLTSFNLNNKLELQKENDAFMRVFPDVIRNLTDFATKKYAMKDAVNHFARALEYNVPHGKKIRGLTIVIIYKELVANQGINTPEQILNAHLLGWCMELIQSVYLMSDDMVDQSEMRRSKRCWYLVNDVQAVAVNDILMIEHGCYELLRRYFGHLTCYSRLVDIFHETEWTTFIGQSVDFHLAKAGITQFTMQKYIEMSNCKTSHSAFYATVALPLILAGYKDSAIFDDLKQISFQLGNFYQVQNDYFDVFSLDDDVLQKPGTDIEDGKCTWLAVQAMQYANDEQKRTLEDCYGKKDPKCVDQVKQVYMDLQFPDMYGQYAERTYNNINLQIERFARNHNIPKNILLKTLNRLFNRD